MFLVEMYSNNNINIYCQFRKNLTKVQKSFSCAGRS